MSATSPSTSSEPAAVQAAFKCTSAACKQFDTARHTMQIGNARRQMVVNFVFIFGHSRVTKVEGLNSPDALETSQIGDQLHDLVASLNRLRIQFEGPLSGN